MYLCNSIYFILSVIFYKCFWFTINKNFIYYFNALFPDSSVYQRKIYLMFAVPHYDTLCHKWQLGLLFSINQNINWVAKYSYLQQHFLCISTLTGHMAENLQKYLSLPLNILQYVQIPGETNGYSEFCLLYLTIYQNKNQRHFCQTQYRNFLI